MSSDAEGAGATRSGQEVMPFSPEIDPSGLFGASVSNLAGLSVVYGTRNRDFRGSAFDALFTGANVSVNRSKQAGCG